MTTLKALPYLCVFALLSPFAWAGTIAAGTDHSLAIKDDGSVWSWGDNATGELGIGTSGAGTGSLVPVQVSGLSNVVAVAAGQGFSVALDESGNVWTWGDDAGGQIGDGASTTGRTSPYQVSGLSGVIGIAAGQEFVLALKSDQTIWAWGKNANGQLGNNSTTLSNVPVHVLGVGGAGNLSNVVGIAAGGFHSLAVTSSGSVYAWGKWNSGQLGIGTVSANQKTPVQVVGIGGTSTLGNVVALAAGLNNSYALFADGTMAAWGDAASGQLGINDSTTDKFSPVQVLNTAATAALTDIAGIAAGDQHALAITTGGALWAFGKNSNGQIGVGSTASPKKTPQQVKDAAGTGTLANVVAISGGVGYSLAVRSTMPGTAWAWGKNTAGQLGDNSTTQRTLPVQVSGDGFTSQVRIPVFTPAGGLYSTGGGVAITSATPNATVRYTMGVSPADPDLTSTALPAGQTVPVTTSTTIKAKAWSGTLTPSVVAQATYSLKVPTPTFSPAGGGAAFSSTPQSITISAPGASIYYTTNGATPTTASTPYTVPLSLTTATTLKAIAVQAGWIDSDVATASYAFELGTLDPPTIDKPTGTYLARVRVTLTSIAGASIRYTLDGTDPDTGNWIAYSGPIAIDANLTLKARAYHPDWITSGIASATYTIVPGSIAAGTDHSLAIDASGNVWAWGGNGNGQLGLGGGSDRLVPTQIPSFTSIKAVAAGTRHSLALKTNGTVWAWGDNFNGKLGDNSTTQRSSPVQVSGLTNIIAIAAGDNHSLALSSTGAVYAWGFNSSGQLGTGNNTASSVPVQVTLVTGTSIAIAAGNDHSVVLSSDGTVWTFGQNVYGQLGLGSTTPSSTSTPQHISSGVLSTVTAIGAGPTWSYAIKGDGTMRGWGRNNQGQPGTGSSGNDLLSPTASSLTTVTTANGGEQFALALLADMTPRSWGYNQQGQLGTGDTTTRTAPGTMLGPTSVILLEAGARHGLALDGDGALWGWGENSNGRVGDGTTVQRNTPVRISDGNLTWRVSTPVLNPGTGQYTSTRTVTVTMATSGASFCYTTDGSTPTTSCGSPLASGATVAVNQSLTLKVVAFKSGMPSSAVEVAAYELKVPFPSLTESIPSPRKQAFTVTVNCPVTGTDSHYTRNGVVPTQSDPAIACGAAITVDYSQVLTVRGWKAGWTPSDSYGPNYTLTVADPVLSGTLPATATTTTLNAPIHYTTNGVDPLETDPVIPVGGVALSTSTTFKVRAFRQGWTPSNVVAQTYSLSLGTVAAPTFEPAAGTYTVGQTVSIKSSTLGTEIRYTLDGSAPNDQSPLFMKPIAVNGSVTLKARAFKRDYVPSSTTSGAYTINDGAVAQPTFDVPAGRYSTKRNVTIATATSGATIYYTTDGTDPSSTNNQGQFTTSGSLNVNRSLVLKARAYKSGLPTSGIARADYRVTGATSPTWDSMMALTANGDVFTWGTNGYGQLGDGTTTAKSTIPSTPVLTSAAAIAGGGSHAVVLLTDGTVKTFGRNNQGQLGKGAAGDSSTPVTVVTSSGTLTGIVAVAAGSDNGYALRGSDGAVFVWGANGSGQLGIGSTSPSTSNVAVQVTSLTGVVAISAGDAHCLALKADGTVAAWGANGSGQLGNGNTTSQSSPVAVSALTGVSRIATGGISSMAIKSDGWHSGTLWSWGSGAAGRLGEGTTLPRNTPISGLLDAQIPGSSSATSFSITTDGTTWSWGDGNAIGDGTSFERWSPVRILGARDLVDIDGGFRSALVVRANGELRAWGSSSTGGLGDGVPNGGSSSPIVLSLSLASNSWMNADTDGDGLTNAAEYRWGSDPLDPDSNGDGLSDGAAVGIGVSPTSPDTDSDGLLNSAELALGTDPFKADTDGDGVLDGADAYPLDATQSSGPGTNPNDHTPPTITLLEPTNATLLP